MLARSVFDISDEGLLKLNAELVSVPWVPINSIFLANLLFGFKVVGLVFPEATAKCFAENGAAFLLVDSSVDGFVKGLLCLLLSFFVSGLEIVTDPVGPTDPLLHVLARVVVVSL